MVLLSGEAMLQGCSCKQLIFTCRRVFSRQGPPSIKMLVGRILLALNTDALDGGHLTFTEKTGFFECPAKITRVVHV